MKKIRGTTASYVKQDGAEECDLEELAQTYRFIGKIPEHIGWKKACEIALLAQAFLILYKADRVKRELRGEGGK